MQPRFHSGDLAIVRPEATYRVGQIVAYHSTLLHVTVLHRIIRRDGNRYVFKGDNNDFIDPTHPTHAELLGALWLLVPHGGRVLKLLHSPVGAAILCGALGLLLVLGRRERQRRHRRRAGPGNEIGGLGALPMKPQIDNEMQRPINWNAFLTASAISRGGLRADRTVRLHSFRAQAGDDEGRLCPERDVRLQRSHPGRRRLPERRRAHRRSDLPPTRPPTERPHRLPPERRWPANGGRRRGCCAEADRARWVESQHRARAAHPVHRRPHEHRRHAQSARAPVDVRARRSADRAAGCLRQHDHRRAQGASGRLCGRGTRQDHLLPQPPLPAQPDAAARRRRLDRRGAGCRLLSLRRLVVGLLAASGRLRRDARHRRERAHDPRRLTPDRDTALGLWARRPPLGGGRPLLLPTQAQRAVRGDVPHPGPVRPHDRADRRRRGPRLAAGRRAHDQVAGQACRSRASG